MLVERERSLDVCGSGFAVALFDVGGGSGIRDGAFTVVQGQRWPEVQEYGQKINNGKHVSMGKEWAKLSLKDPRKWEI